MKKLTYDQQAEIISAYNKVAEFYGYNTIGKVISGDYYKGEIKFAWGEALYMAHISRDEKKAKFENEWEKFKNILNERFEYKVDDTFESKLKITITEIK